MLRKHKIKIFALVIILLLSLITSVVMAAFTSTVSSTGNLITATPDLTPPVIVRSLVVRTQANVTGKIKEGDSYRIYAYVNNDTGNPASGINEVIANASNITTGEDNVSMTSGNYTFNSQDYNYRSPELTSNNPLSEGNKSFTITAEDFAGNISDDFSNTVQVDNTPPDLYIYSPTTSFGLSTSIVYVIFYPIPVDDVATYRCKIGLLGVWRNTCVANSSSNQFLGVSNGANTAYVEATDQLGNVSLTTSDFNVDAPVLTINHPANNSYVNSSTLTPSFSTVESPISNGSGFDYTYVCSLDGSSDAICPSSYSGLSEGVHTLRVISGNDAGEYSPYVTHTFTVDLTPPELTMITPTADMYIGGDNITYNFSVNETSTFECKINGGSYNTCSPNSSGATFNNLSSGSNTAYVRATDQAGNQTTVSTSFNVDPFTITYDSPADNSYNTTGDVTITFHATESAHSGGNDTFTYECNPNNTSYTSCSSPVTYNNVPDGTHFLIVRATNSVGYTVSKTITVIFDSTQPEITRSIIQKTSGLNSGYVQANTSYYAYAQVSDAGTGVNSVTANLNNITTGQTSAAMSNGAWTVNGQSYNYRSSLLTSNVGLSDGSKNFTINADDIAGNSNTYDNNVIADSTAPTIPTSVISKTPGYLSGSVKQGGSYYILANPTDTNGISSAVANVNNITTGQTSVNLTSGSYSAQGISYSYRTSTFLTASNPLTAGSKSYTVTATDNAGNTSSAISFSVTVDNTAPAGSAVDATNGSGGTTGKIENGDRIILTYNSLMDPESIKTGWDGSSTSVSVVGTNANTANCGGVTNTDTFSISGTNLGCMSSGSNSYVTTCATGTTFTFATSTMVILSGTVTITLGGLQSTTCTFPTVGTNARARWGVITNPYDAAGNIVTTRNISESGNDANF